MGDIFITRSNNDTISFYYVSINNEIIIYESSSFVRNGLKRILQHILYENPIISVGSS